MHIAFLSGLFRARTATYWKHSAHALFYTWSQRVAPFLPRRIISFRLIESLSLWAIKAKAISGMTALGPIGVMCWCARRCLSQLRRPEQIRAKKVLSLALGSKKLNCCHSRFVCADRLAAMRTGNKISSKAPSWAYNLAQLLLVSTKARRRQCKQNKVK